mmetsp:Transcript_43526/g.114883  ORF Transcript_43526/g.114883 Transcript_43526/m.114883 type:complete len:80 (-) Transcript_43526:169-408(-)
MSDVLYLGGGLPTRDLNGRTREEASKSNIIHSVHRVVCLFLLTSKASKEKWSQPGVEWNADDFVETSGPGESWHNNFYV